MPVTAAQIIIALKTHKNVLLYGPPGTGKTYLMHQVAQRFATGDIDDDEVTPVLAIDTEAETHPLVNLSVSTVAVRWVTFHQGYSYEDFVIGLRPDTAAEVLLALKAQPGILLELAAEVLDGAEAGLLLIDEINRGNASRIFGEFITLLEPDKRLGAEGAPTPQTVTVNLPYVGQGEEMKIPTAHGEFRQGRDFRMPAQVYTLASMNSVDKSVAPIDTALRRRFHIIGLSPSASDVREAAGVGDRDRVKPADEIDSRPEVAAVAAETLVRLNRGIGLYLGPEFALGQWYLAALRDPNLTGDRAKALVGEIWLFRLLPQMLELFHGRTEQLTAVLRVEELGECPGLRIQRPRPDEEDLGAAPFVSAQESPTDTVLAYLARFAGATETPTSSTE